MPKTPLLFSKLFPKVYYDGKEVQLLFIIIPAIWILLSCRHNALVNRFAKLYNILLKTVIEILKDGYCFLVPLSH